MKLDPVIRRETVYMTLSILVCTVLLQAGFVLFGQWNISVLIGGIVGWIMASGNFFLMSLNIQKAVECGDENEAKMKMRASYTWRMSAMLGIMIVTFIVDFIHWLPVVASVFYPRIVIPVRQLWQKFVLKVPQETPGVSAPAPDVTEEEEDGFEKALGHFVRNIKTDYPAQTSAKKDDAADDEEKGRS